MWRFKQLDRDQREAYQESLGAEKIRLSRVLIVLAGVLFLSFTVLDFWAIPSAIVQVGSIRLVVTTMLAFAFAATWHKDYLRFYSLTMVTILLAIGISTNVMIMLAGPGDIAREHYFGGLMLTIFGVFGLTYLNPWISLSMSVLLISQYLVVASDLKIAILATHINIYVATTIIGFVALNVRDRFSQENFLLRHRLQEDVNRKHEEARRAAHLADHDSLTGLPNRMRFFKDAKNLLAQAKITASEAAVLFIDLNAFKPINDRHGHAIGDRVLRVVAERLRDCLRGNDLVARIGGDEFVAFVTVDDTEPGSVQAIVSHISNRIQNVIDSREGPMYITAAIGTARYPTDGTNLEELLQRADEDMYRVKSNPNHDSIGPAGRQSAR